MSGNQYPAGAKVDRTPIVRETRSSGGNFDTAGGLESVGRISDEQRDAARLNLARFALEHPDPAGWLAGMLSVLGLDGRQARMVGRCQACAKPIGNRGTEANRRGFCTVACRKGRS